MDRAVESGERVRPKLATRRARSSIASSGARRVWALTVVLAAAGTAIVTGAVGRLGPVGGPLRLPWWAFALAFFLSEAFVIRLPVRRDSHSFSLSEIPLVLGYFFASPVQLVAARVLGGGVAGSRRQSPLKLAFNICQYAVSTGVGVLVFRSIVIAGDPIGPRAWAGVFASTLAMDVVSAVLISAAISLREGRLETGSLAEVVGFGALLTFTNAGMGLMAVALLWWDVRAAWLLVLAGLALFLAYRGYATVRQRHESLRLLYESTRMAQQPFEAESLVAAVLAHAAQMFRAETAEIVLFGPPEERARATRTAISPDGSVAVEAVWLDPADPFCDLVVAQGGAVLAPRSARDESIRRHLETRGLRDAMLATLRSESDVVGTMLVGNRMGDVGTFDEGDLRLFETLANHVSVALDNAQLIGRLRRQAAENRYMALHDSLTDLPNRTLFRMRAQQAITDAAGQDAAAGIMIIDLDRFKEVNDTLGHHMGDLILQEVGSRLRACIDDGAVARLGGDEFAVLLPRLRRREDAEAVADRVLAVLERPFVFQDLSLDVGASVGIALFPEHGRDAETLMQRADVAMYLAKEERAGFATYDPARDRYTPERLQLVGELRRAIENGELALYFQPKADLRTGTIVGVEALVRWDHPRRGMLFPDEFVPLAEHTGLIRQMTTWVLGEALRHCRRWARAGIELSVAVNVSARSLLDVSLPTAIGELLATWGVPASLLEIEITESSIMADPARSVAVLNRLSAMGVGLAIDDFGTGYSSLSYLKRLPVDEIKIDRSFVMQMLDDQDDAVIVRSTVDLCRNLSLRVVAEGVESQEIMNALSSLGCDLVQGYYLSPPMPADEVVAWTRGHRARMRSGAQEPHARPAGGTVAPLVRPRARNRAASAGVRGRSLRGGRLPASSPEQGADAQATTVTVPLMNGWTRQ